MAAPARSSHKLLRDVARWGCQYQNLDIAALADSDLDMIVIEPSLNDDLGLFVSPDEIEVLKRKPNDGRRLVIGYLSIGEVDTKRWYWPEHWRRDPPAWLGSENPAWPGSHPVRYWEDGWIDLLLGTEPGLLNLLLDRGYDGVLLDRVDAFTDWRMSVPDADRRMVALVVQIAKAARKKRRGFLLLTQNAEPLLQYDAYRQNIDGMNKESLLTGLRCQDCMNSAEDVTWSLDFIEKARNDGLKLFATEYLSDSALIEPVRKRLAYLGFTPFLGVRNLDKLPI
ncbi:MAG: endo alpha-1,4 polygalactosaminidase [Pseudomonadota bacterium]|nr:endo alpha-1,4 polygalactosaminidase [Pseudomonadota bacterium]